MASIHPRVQNGRTVHPKHNTSFAKRRTTIERAITGLTKHCDQHPKDGESYRHLAALQERLRTAN